MQRQTNRQTDRREVIILCVMQGERHYPQQCGDPGQHPDLQRPADLRPGGHVRVRGHQQYRHTGRLGGGRHHRYVWPVEQSKDWTTAE